MNHVVEKLKWRSRRSMLELDLFFDSYIKSGKLDKLSNEYLEYYSILLEVDDGELLELFHGKNKLRDTKLQFLIDEIRSASK
ncbi:MAG: succinate dehydrogenase assembly factor 2 [Neisseriaceae bacterium]|jgi:succinate dehydrogenase flavin-adding protein (antitoxin of CptAB toxin-antitoxin module)